MNTTDLLFKYIKELGVQSSLGVIGAAASIVLATNSPKLAKLATREIRLIWPELVVGAIQD